LNKKDFHRIRERRKIGLQTFFINLQNNNYDTTTDNLIAQLKAQLSDLNQKKPNLRNQELSDCAMDIYFLERELLAISEMKIIYAFKNFETHLVWLLKASYNSELQKRIFKWETIKDFLLSKKIRLSAINGYEEINQLRLLNNSIKHSLKAKPSDLKCIKEFQGKENIHFQDFLNFYKRIEGQIIIFISSLSDKIETDLYQFDEDRLEALSDSYKERMDNATLEKFISKLDPAK
jgi:hypothetical protein